MELNPSSAASNPSWLRCHAPARSLGGSIRLGELCREFVEAGLALRSLSGLLLLALARRQDVGQYVGLVSVVRILDGDVDRFNDAREVLLVGGVGGDTVTAGSIGFAHGVDAKLRHLAAKVALPGLPGYPRGRVHPDFDLLGVQRLSPHANPRDPVPFRC